MRNNRRLPSIASPQTELLDKRADTTFSHLFASIYATGDAREMGDTAFMVFCCIKAHSDIGTGLSYPSKERVAELCGKSHPTVERAIKKLIEMDRVEVYGKRGRNNVYRCKERFQITDGEGRALEDVGFDYVPRAVSEVQRQVRQYIEQGRVEGQPIIHIEKIEVNINYGTQIEQQIVAENVQMNGKDDREALFERMNAARKAEFAKIKEIIPGVRLKDEDDDTHHQ